MKLRLEHIGGAFLLCVVIFVTLALQGCEERKDPEWDASCNAETTQDACKKAAPFCYWVGCEGDTYKCTSGDSEETTCNCEHYYNESAGEACPDGALKANTCEPSATDGCGCRNCTKEDKGPTGLGRLFIGQSGSLTATVARATSTGDCDWSHGFAEKTLDESAQRVHREINEDIASFYKDAGLAEHASVASFSRAVLEMMENGAPAWLVDRTLVAAREEVQHAQMAFAIAREWSAEQFSIGGMDGIRAQAETKNTLTDFAKRAVMEACVGETFAVMKMQMAEHFVEDEHVRQYIAKVNVEEQRHAELAWMTVAWSLSKQETEGPNDIRSQVSEALTSSIAAMQAKANKALTAKPRTTRATTLLHVGILPPDVEAIAAKMSIPLMERLRTSLMHAKMTGQGLRDFELVVHQHFEIAAKEVSNARKELSIPRKEVV